MSFAANRVSVIAPLLAGLAALHAGAATYEVGSESPLHSIGEVPWASLQSGDQVLIHWRPEPYREKWVISNPGTSDAPIVVRGVAGPDGKLPAIQGQNAKPAQTFRGEDRAILKIGDGAGSAEPPPSHIVIENLDISGANPAASYVPYASAIWIQKGSDITVRRCLLHDCANGLITSHESARVLIEKCEVFDNGIEKSSQQHNIYTESAGIVFQFNRVGPLRMGAVGNTLKDRSSDTVIRYNWLEGGSRVLDLVDSDYETIRSQATYKETYVYGNVLEKDETGANNQIIHYGGDSGQEDHYRRGVLNFYHNTVLVRRLPSAVLFRLSSAEDSMIAVNNIFCTTTPGSRFSALAGPGTAALDHNLFAPGWKAGFEKGGEENVKWVHNFADADPAFVSVGKRDLHPTAAAVSAGQPLSAAVADNHPVKFEYLEPCQSAARPAKEPPDIGAFSRVSAPNQ